jgi:acyl carrier protein
VETIEAKLFALVLEEFCLAPGSLTGKTRLPDLGDSLDWLSLMSAIEDAFGVEISHEQALELATIEDVLHFLEEPALA